MSDPLAGFGDAWGGRWAAITILPIIFEMDAFRGTPHEERTQRLGFAASSLATVGLVTALMKVTVGRERPNGRGYQSFPSGHTSISFGVAEVVSTLYGNWWGMPFYGAALITGISRIHDNKHYLSDVMAGAGLGVGIVRGFRLSWRTAARTELSFLVHPSGTVTALIRF
jgi:membrane-associated phospholipid phosphatase